MKINKSKILNWLKEKGIEGFNSVKDITKESLSKIPDDIYEELRTALTPKEADASSDKPEGDEGKDKPEPEAASDKGSEEFTSEDAPVNPAGDVEGKDKPEPSDFAGDSLAAYRAYAEKAGWSKDKAKAILDGYFSQAKGLIEITEPEAAKILKKIKIEETANFAGKKERSQSRKPDYRPYVVNESSPKFNKFLAELKVKAVPEDKLTYFEVENPEQGKNLADTAKKYNIKVIYPGDFSSVDGDSEAFKAGKEYGTSNPDVSEDDIKKKGEELGYKDNDLRDFQFGCNSVVKKAENFNEDEDSKEEKKAENFSSYDYLDDLLSDSAQDPKPIEPELALFSGSENVGDFYSAFL